MAMLLENNYFIELFFNSILLENNYFMVAIHRFTVSVYYTTHYSDGPKWERVPKN